MRAIRLSILLAGLALILGGCVSTTDGAVERPKPTSDDAAQSLYSLGAQYYKNGDYDLARDRLKESLEFNPDRPLTWTALALTYEALGNERLAQESYREAVRVAPRDFNVLNTYAVYLCRQGEFNDAKRYFDRAIDAPTNDYSEITLTNAGVCMMDAPDFAEAEAYLREALAQNRNYAEALLQMARLKLITNEDLSARAFIQRYFAISEPTAQSLRIGWEVEFRLGDDRARDEYYSMLQDRFPGSPEARDVQARNN